MEIVSFEIAKKLKEKGYPQVIDKYADFYPDGVGELVAPTISQVLKWLREEKKIYVSVEVEREDWFEYKIVQTIKNTRKTGTRVYETYSEAILAGIEYVLDNLI